MVIQKQGGVFPGRARITKKYVNGGSRHVTAEIQGIKNNLVWAPFGGILQNPFPGAAKLYEADPLYIEYDEYGENPKLWCVKTYQAAATSNGTSLKLYRDGFRHKVFVGDTLMVAPDTFGGEGPTANVLSVTETTDGNEKIWSVVLDRSLSVSKNDVLVEGIKIRESESGRWIIKGTVNGWTPCDMDFVYEPVSNVLADNFDDAQYGFTPVAGVCAYLYKMSPLPKAILDLNRCLWNGIYMHTATPI